MCRNFGAIGVARAHFFTDVISCSGNGTVDDSLEAPTGQHTRRGNVFEEVHAFVISS